MGKAKIVIDTNVYISALGWEGACRDILISVFEGRFENYLSPKQIEEISFVMGYEKFRFSRIQKDRFLTQITESSILINPSRSINILSDTFDNAVLESAAEADADFIISGDRHLLSLKDFEGIKIVSPKSFTDGFLKK